MARWIYLRDKVKHSSVSLSRGWRRSREDTVLLATEMLVGQVSNEALDLQSISFLCNPEHFARLN